MASQAMISTGDGRRAWLNVVQSSRASPRTHSAAQQIVLRRGEEPIRLFALLGRLNVAELPRGQAKLSECS